MLSAMLRAGVRIYRHAFSPLLPPCCRFYPTCSAYADEALRLHGAVRGGWLTMHRLCRCGPWTHGGFDPVPLGRSRDAD